MAKGIEEVIDGVDAEVTASEQTDKQLADGKEEKAPPPSFKKFADARIPVSSKMGPLWKSRHDAGYARLKGNGTYDAWDETIRYYKNDQTGKRNRNDPDNPGGGSERELGTQGKFAQTENIVFSNVSALVPSIYAKNPDVSVFSSKGDQDQKFIVTVQKLIRTLLQRRTAPGINLKPKARRGVVLTTLTNISYIEVGYTRREHAVETTMAEIDAIAVKLKDAKTTKEIEELEGQLMALDEKVDLLQPAGPWAVVRNAKDVIVDPDSQLPDHSDAKWIMVREVFETSFLNAMYREKDEETGQYKSIYKPTHVLSASADNANIAGHDQDITSFSLLKGAEHNASDYGYNDENTFKRAQRTLAWRVWDRTTRRVYLFTEENWNWPIWVWDDPYGLDDFIPLYPLAFHCDPEDAYARGEVSYYLDQQDEINRINTQVAIMRDRISNVFVYDRDAVKNEADLTGLIAPTNGKRLIGIQVQEGKKIGDLLSAPPIPATEFASLFDKRSLYDAIDRVSGVPSVVKGVEFRTNTTNKAIDSYESSSAMRLDEKIDAIEEQVGRISYAVLIMCLQFMSQQEVVRLIGQENAQAWPGNMSARDAQHNFQLTVTGGSTLKPTSKVRKEQAKEAAQIIGQFGASNPIAFLVVLKMFQRAFSDELVIEPGDWDMIVGHIEQQLQAPLPVQHHLVKRLLVEEVRSSLHHPPPLVIHEQ